MFTYDDEWDFFDALYELREDDSNEAEDDHPSLTAAERNPSLRGF